MIRKILLLIVASLALSSASVRGKGVRYYGTDPYAALDAAQQQRKLLLVEFYAPWNSRSSWMHDRVISQSGVKELLEDNFICVLVDTSTEPGAALALDYEVTDYPSIVIFNANGAVLDKIDTSLDKEDFTLRIRTLLASLKGSSAWQLQMIFGALNRGDVAEMEELTARYLSSVSPEELIGSVSWPLFENNALTYYYTVSFDYLLAHLDRMRQVIGRDTVDAALDEKLMNAMLSYLTGAKVYSEEAVAGIRSIAEQTGSAEKHRLDLMAAAAAMRHTKDYGQMMVRYTLLAEQLPEWMVFPMVASLGVVSGASREVRNEASKMIGRTMAATKSPAERALLENLRARLK